MISFIRPFSKTVLGRVLEIMRPMGSPAAQALKQIGKPTQGDSPESGVWKYLGRQTDTQPVEREPTTREKTNNKLDKHPTSRQTPNN